MPHAQLREIRLLKVQATRYEYIARTVGTEIAIPEGVLGTQDISSARLPTHV
jgi:hypothetical protein